MYELLQETQCRFFITLCKKGHIIAPKGNTPIGEILKVSSRSLSTHRKRSVQKEARPQRTHYFRQHALYCYTELFYTSEKPSGFPFSTRYIPLQLFQSQLKFLLDLLVSRSIGVRNCVRLKVQHGPTTKLGAVGHRAQTVPADVLQVGHGCPFW